MKFSEFEDHFFETIEVALAPLIDTAWDIWEPPDPEPNILEDIFAERMGSFTRQRLTYLKDFSRCL